MRSSLLIVAALALLGTLPDKSFADDRLDCGLAATAGVESAELQQRTAACSKLIEAGNKNPVTLSEFYNNRGVFHDLLGQYENALADYSNAIRLNPNFSDAYVGRGAAQYNLGHAAQAISDYSRAIQLSPNSAKIFDYRGNAYDVSGRQDLAILDYNEAIRIDPNFAPAYFDRGIVYKAKGQSDAAIADYGEAIRLDPNLTGAYYNRALLYFHKGQYDRSLADLNSAIQLRPNDAQLLTDRGAVYQELGQFDRSIEDSTTAIRLDPNIVRAYSNRGAAYASKEKYSQAITDFTEANRLDPSNASLLVSRARALFLNGQVDKSLPDFDAAIRLDPKMADAYFYRGLYFQEKGDTTKARADFKKSLEIDSSQADVLEALKSLDSKSNAPRIPSPEEILKTSHLHLAAGFLAVETTMLQADKLVNAGWKFETTLDGKEETITPSNLETYLKAYRARLDIYREAIEKRGSVAISGRYAVTANAKCKGGQIDFRGLFAIDEKDGKPIMANELVVRQTGFKVDLLISVKQNAQDSELDFSGVTVKDAVVFRVQNSNFHLWGKIKKRAILLSLNVQELTDEFGRGATTPSELKQFGKCLFELTPK